MPIYHKLTKLNFIKEPTLAEVKTAIDGMIIAETELVDTYDRSGN